VRRTDRLQWAPLGRDTAWTPDTVRRASRWPSPRPRIRVPPPIPGRSVAAPAHWLLARPGNPAVPESDVSHYGIALGKRATSHDNAPAPVPANDTRLISIIEIGSSIPRLVREIAELGNSTLVLFTWYVCDVCHTDVLHSPLRCSPVTARDRVLFAKIWALRKDQAIFR